MDRRALGGFRSWRVPITAPVRGRAGRELAYALLMPLMAGLGLLYLLVVLLGVIATANIVGVPFLALCVVGEGAGRRQPRAGARAGRGTGGGSRSFPLPAWTAQPARGGAG
ncbi:hypothetical protein ACFQGX_35440 [Nonomuraea dietziae]|uniref:hypothetical protein n=1 Tax=Nonomuraea dietziae TaxID=65515 RepID=UPI0036077FBE